jgi:hypothetical protein
MATKQELIEAADRNFIGSYRKLVDHSPEGEAREFGGVFAFVTRLPIGMFNGCIVSGPAAPYDLAAAVRWITERDVPFRLWVHEDLTDEPGEIRHMGGMAEEPWLMPEMVLHPTPEPPSSAPGVEASQVSDRRSLEQYRRVLIDDGTPESIAQRLISDSFAADPDVALVTTHLGGRPVGTSLAIRTGTVSGVYAVGTVLAARRRGVGTAATWGAVEAGRSWGCDTIVLQSSEMGFSVYEAMGFRTVVRYRVFRPAG